MRRVGVEGHVPEEHGPRLPVNIGDIGLASREALGNVVCRSSKAIAETSMLDGVHSHHISLWWYVKSI